MGRGPEKVPVPSIPCTCTNPAPKNCNNRPVLTLFDDASRTHYLHCDMKKVGDAALIPAAYILQKIWLPVRLEKFFFFFFTRAHRDEDEKKCQAYHIV